MKRFILLGACIPMMLAGSVQAQQVLNLQESPPASGLFSAQVSDAYVATGLANAKQWIFNAEGNDRVSFHVRTTAFASSSPILRLTNSGGTVISELTGSGDGFGTMGNILLTTPGVYQIAVYSNASASAFTMQALLGRGISLEAEANQSATQANQVGFKTQSGGFLGAVAGILDRDEDWSDLGILKAGDAVNLSLQSPTGSSLVTSAVELSLFKDADTAAVATATGSALVHSIATTGRYRIRTRVPDLDGFNAHFTGSQSLSLGNPAALQITGSQTIEFWVKPDDFSTRQNPYAKAYAGEGTMTIETNGTINYYYGTGGGNTPPNQSFGSVATLRAGRWQHIALVRDFSSTPKQLRWYFDGKLVAQADAAYFPATAGTLPVTLGNGYAGVFRGAMDEVRLWNVARSASEIAANLGNPLTGSESGLVAYYRFGEGSGTTAADTTSNAITGTFTAAPNWDGSTAASLANFVPQGINATYLLNYSVSDTTAPSVTAFNPVPIVGYIFDGTSAAPANMTAQRGKNDQAFLYTLTGDTGGSIWGTDTYTDDSSLAKAAVHAGVLRPGEIGAVRVTVKPGQASYSASTRNGVSSNSYGSFAGSFVIERYTPASPFTLNALYTSLNLSFNEPLDPAALNGGVTLVAAGPDGNFGTDDDHNYPLTLTQYTWDYPTVFSLGTTAVLAPGAHRLTVAATVADRSGNTLSAPHVEDFTVVGIGSYVNESGSNNTLATADSLSLNVAANQPGGSFSDFGRTMATGEYPYDIELADLDRDGKLDAAVTHLGAIDGLRLYKGNGDRSFAAPVNFDGIGDQPHDVMPIDWDKDGDLDLVVSIYGSDAVGLFRNDSVPGTLTFTRQPNVAAGDGAYRLATADFNGDGWLDLACSNYLTSTTTGYSVSVLLNDQAGSFIESKIGLTLSPRIRPWALTAGDFNKDGKADLAAGDVDNGERVAIFLGAGDGSFGVPSFLDLPAGADPSDMAVADFNQDGNPDLAVQDYNSGTYDFAIFPGNGDGTFGTRADIILPYGNDNQFFRVADLNGDSWPDLVTGGESNLSVVTNRANGALTFDSLRRLTSEYHFGIAVGDLNGDGPPELVSAGYHNFRLRVLDGIPREPLAADDPATGIRHGYGRGFMTDTADYDCWSFTANRGEALTVAVDLSAFAGTPSLLWEIYDEVGTRFTYFYNDSNSYRDQSTPVTIPRDGTYYVRAHYSSDYRGEYRFRVSLAPPGTQLESENNHTIATSDPVSFSLSGNSLSATTGGYIAGYDTVGDFFNLGNLAAGTQITANLRLPTTSTLTPALALFKANGTAVTPTTLTPTQLIYTLQPGDEATYHLRVSGSAGRGLMAEYFADLLLADVEPPAITSNSLPAEGTTVTFFSSTFTLGFSEDMIAATVNATANYEMLGSGGDGIFGNGNDVVYAVNSPGYSSGLSASYLMPDGPLQPDTYRFTVATALKDKLNNNLAAPHVRNFTIAGVPGWVLEGRNNNTLATADTLSLNVAANQPDGSFSDFGRTLATGEYPYDIELADLDRDGKLDAAVTHLNNLDGLRLYKGNGDRTFAAPVNFDGIGDQPHDVMPIDWDKDGDLDLVVSIYGSDAVGLFRNDSVPGTLTFTRQPNVAAGDGAYRLATADFNGDGWPDLACSNYLTSVTTGNSVSVLLNDQAGSFIESKIGLTLSPRIRPWALTAGDFNKDGKADLAAGDVDNGERVAIFLGAGDGSFGAPSFLDLPAGADPSDMAVADFNQDGNPDLAVLDYNSGTYDFAIFPGNGDGTFGTRADIILPYGNDNRFFRVADLNGDFWPDLVTGGESNLSVVTNRATGALTFDSLRRLTSEYHFGIAVGDLNGDGPPELVSAGYHNFRLRVLDGIGREPLAADDPATGIRHGYGRGFMTDTADYDYWSFTANRGDALTVAVDLSAFAGTPSLLWEIFDEVGTRFTYFYNDSNSYRDQSTPVTIPRDGTYYVRVRYSSDYRGEYRFRVSLAPPGTQLESENNHTIATSDPVSFSLSGNSLSATTGGYIAGYDTVGDYFNLGNLAAGTQITANLRLPTTSTLTPALALFKANGTAVTPTTLTPTQLIYTLQPGDEATYHLRVSGSAGRGLMAEYFADLLLADVEPPVITSNSLPAEGTTVTFFSSSFTLGFNEDMIAATVNATANYELIGSGGDGVFGNGNDVVYAVNSPGYSSGLSASYFMPDGPLQPDTYRFTVATALKDRLNNNLAAPHVRNFTIAGVPGWVLEDRNNNTLATADTLSLNVAANQPDGSFSDFGRTMATGEYPYDIELADLDGDGKLDAAVTHLNNLDGLRLYKGNGDRTFAAPINFDGIGDQPHDVMPIDWDKDGDLDLVVSIYGSDAVGRFRNDSIPGTLTFTRQPNVAAGDGAYRLATADFNGDGWPDLACSNHLTNAATGNSVSVLLNDQTGSFTESKIGLTLSPRIRPWALTAGDFNKDGKADLAASDIDNGDRVAVFLGVGDGSFGAPSFLDLPDGSDTTDMAVADFNQDGNPDLALLNYNSSTYDFAIFPGAGDGTFGTRADIILPYGNENRFFRVADLNGDFWPDLVTGGESNLSVVTNRANGTLTFDSLRRLTSEYHYGIAVGDLNGDGPPELVSAGYHNFRLRVLDGIAREPLAADDPATGIRHGYGRGFMTDSSDYDCWSFTANRGEALTVAVDLSAFAGTPSLLWEIYDEVGTRFTYFYNDSNSYRDQSTPVTIPRDGTYYVRVRYSSDYRGEYRFRVSLAPPGTQLESENNHTIATSDPVSFSLSGNSLSATTGGYIAGYDTVGDYFNLGNLAAGTQVTANLRLPTTSTLTPALALFKANGTAVTPTTLTPTQLIYTLQPGDEATYHLRVSGSAGRGLMAEYFADLMINDTVPPAITASTLPTGTTGELRNSFSLSFNKDMLASTINNAANYALVWAGGDGDFSTADDAVVAITPGSYAAGLSNSYTIANAPLRPGNYRFTATVGLRDKFGNNLPLPFETLFTISQLNGFLTESEPNNTTGTTTPLVFNTDIPGYLTASGRGILAANFNDIEYWTFPAEAGDLLAFEVRLPYEAATARLNWYLTDPDGVVVFNRNLGTTDLEANAPLTLTKTGTYRLRIDDNDAVRTEHRFRVSLLRGLASESEQNDNLLTADPLAFTGAGGIDTASVAGFVSTSTELDYFDLGTISAGNTVFLTVRRPSGSTLGPIVSLYNQAGTLMGETNGVAGDDSAEITISSSGRYYALLRASFGTHGLNGDYILDARVLPSTAINFPNLRVTRLDDITAPGLRTGDTINLSYEVGNVGNLATTASLWVDRVVLSANSVYGDADDLQLALITHTGSLPPGASYTVNQPLTLTDGLPGSYYLLVKTDSANAVDEILQEGDNATATANPFNVALRDYPDLVIEDLAVGAADGSGDRQLTWNLANRGSAEAPAGHTTRVQVLNTTTSQIVADLTLPVAAPIAAAATLAQSHTFNTATPGYYLITVSADSGNSVYEYNTSGHSIAELNSSQTNFQIYRYYDIVVTASPPAGGTVTGGGSAREGLAVTVTATPDTSAFPYVFLNWTESGSFVSAQASYTFLPTKNRNLVAVFGLPQFQIAATVSPAGTGSVSGTGNFALNTAVSLTPQPAPGHLFDHWEEFAVNIGSASPLAFNVTASRTLTAVFRESVPSHVVTLVTQPAGVAALAGGGTYTNGQVLAVSAPSRVEQDDAEFLFQRFELNGLFLSSSNALNKTFSTLDPATMSYKAVYQERSLKPVITTVACSHGTLVPIASNVTFTATFDRDMNTAVNPVFTLLSGNASAVPVIPAGGTWLDARRFRCAQVAFGASNGGAYTVRITTAADSLGHVMATHETFGFTMDSIAPPSPLLTISATSPTSATIGWSGYPAPVDLSAFRFYLEDTDFTTVAALSAKGGGNAAVRSTVFTGLLPDHEYFAAVTAVDVAGNAEPTVATIRVFLASQIPPPITPLVTTTGLDSARLDWTSYDTSSLVGLAGFRVFAQTTPFTDVTGLTPVAQVSATTKLHNLTGFDRTQTHYLAVVGYNVLGQLNPAVTPLAWTDPLAGALRTNLAIGGPTAVILILADLTIEDGVTLTVAPGTTLRFADGTGIAVNNGRLVANGTDLLPIHFTSQADDGAGAPVRGSWDGITLASATGVSELSRAWIRYGAGLQITTGSPLATRIYAVQNNGAGIAVSGSAHLDATACYLAFNENGLTGIESADVSVQQSVILNNSVANAAQADTATFAVASNWWGTANAAAIAATLTGSVTATTPLTSERVLGSALAAASGSTDTGTRTIELRLMAVNAVQARASEDSLFTGILFNDLFAPDESNRLRPYGFVVPFTLSTGAGLKTVHLQTNSPTGTTGPTHAVSFNYITGGPVITAFSLTEGQTVSRPLTVTGSATAPLGVKWIDFLVDGTLVARNSSASFTTLWDPRPLGNGIHRIELRARDQAGNESSRTLNVVTSAVPPPAPVIALPVNNTLTNTATVTVAGTAEASVSLRITRNGALVSGTLNAAPNGSFNVPGVPLVEGANELVATAFDSLGSASSTPVTIFYDSGPPAAPVLLPPTYLASRGLQVEWQYAETGERPTKFKVFWHTAAFTTTSQATSQSAFITDRTAYTIGNLADGTWYFSVVGYDDAGNPSALSNQLSTIVDFAKPGFTIAYDGSLPAGPGNLGIILTASEPLVANPIFSLRPAGAAEAVSVPLTRQSATLFTATFAVTTLSATTGTAAVKVSASDLAGNAFNGSPTGPALVFDVTKPTATLSLDRAAPIQTLNPVSVALGLQLSEPLAVGSTPTLKFEPPVGSEVAIPLTNSGTAWTGSINLTPAMGRGTGFFRFSATDRSGNTGTVVTPGTLEIYNTELPDAPARPVGLTAQTLSGGRIQINWGDVPRAETYRIYREPGNNATVPTLLLIDGLTASEFTDTPPADGIFTYAIVASLRGADSLPSGVLNALSDRTPPPVPENFAATLGSSGVTLSWSAPSAGEVPHAYRVYRNDTVIYNTANPFTIRDNPPRGIHQYRVSSLDSHGNENAVTPLTIELLVSPVTNLQILVRDDSPTSLTWQSTDPTVTGYNVYRNGIKQNGAPLANPFFIDPLSLGTDTVNYEVTARNAAGNESPRRSLDVVAAALNLLLNPDADDAEQDSIRFYFDSLRAMATNLATSGDLNIERFDIVRTVGVADSLATGSDTDLTIQPGNTGSTTFVVPAPRTLGTSQTIQLLARGPADPSGGRVSYEKTFTKRPATEAPNIATLQPTVPPLAGGLTDFVATIFNPGPVPIEIIVGRAFGNEPGDVTVLVLDPSGVEVSRKAFKGTGVSPVTIDGAGNAFITIEARSSRSFTIPEIFVPEALAQAGLSATFVLDIAAIRYRTTGGTLLAGGTLTGQTSSSLVQTPYFGTSATDKTFYANTEPVHITGQAIDRTTLLPLPNTALRIGLGARGFVTWQNVTTDAAGNYSYNYTPVIGFAGRLNIWAAHPAVVDQLNQVSIEYRRLYITPGRGDIVMSKNDTIDITLKAINPGDLPAAAVGLTARVFVMQGTNEVPITSIRGALPGGNFDLLPNIEKSVTVRLTADLDAPDSALVDLTFLSADGASVTFRGTLSLRPAVPVLSFVSPRVGYVEGSVNRGNIVSYEVTLENLGLRAVENPVLIPPASLNWIDVNLPRAADGRIVLPDIPVGGKISFGVAFAPPDTVPLGFYNDFLEIRATNLQTPFRANLFAQVTSSQVGEVKFVVDNIFVDRVPNAKVRLRNPNLREELGPFLTDSNGEVTVSNLQEGTWSWQIAAAGHTTKSGTVEVVPSQINLVETRLSKSLVTVEFSVVPKPFTDRYEIVIEQTFETRVPFPVLVFDPPSFAFTNLPDQFETTLLVKVRNEGLISMFDVQLIGEVAQYASLQPLVNYMPELRAQEEVVVPFRLVWNRGGLGSAGSGPVASASGDLGGSISGCADAFFKPNILDDDFMAGINAIGKAIAQCTDGTTAALICSLIVTIDTVDFIMGFFGLEAIAETLGKFLGCIFANYFKEIGIPSGGGGPGGGNGGFAGNGCFPAGTPVTLSDGTRIPIESLARGQTVRTSLWQGHSGQVDDLIIRQSEDLRELALREVRPGKTPLDPADLQLQITGEHLVWNDATGWTAASQLKAGDWVHHESGALLEVVSNLKLPGSHTVYTVEVKGSNAFFAAGLMVQDLCGIQKLGDHSALAPKTSTTPTR